jgi:surfeit locus 1 family protein
MISTFGGSQGWIILTPAITNDGRAVMVDRGRVPVQMLESFEKPQGPQEITGVVRSYTRGKGYFDPENDPKQNLWYWWDVPAMLAASSLPEGAKPLPFVVQVLPGSQAAQFPEPQELKANLSNNHLGYAITWFGLALTLLAVAFAYVREMRKKPAAGTCIAMRQLWRHGRQTTAAMMNKSIA